MCSVGGSHYEEPCFVSRSTSKRGVKQSDPYPRHHLAEKRWSRPSHTQTFPFLSNIITITSSSINHLRPINQSINQECAQQPQSFPSSILTKQDGTRHRPTNRGPRANDRADTYRRGPTASKPTSSRIPEAIIILIITDSILFRRSLRAR